MTTSSSGPAVRLVRQAFDAFNANDLPACLALLADDFVINLAGLPLPLRGKQAWAENYQAVQHAFPGLQATIDDIFGAEDRVAVRLTFHGTHRGEFLGVAATGRDVAYTSIELYRVAGDVLAEEWIASDIPTLMQQLSEATG